MIIGYRFKIVSQYKICGIWWRYISLVLSYEMVLSKHIHTYRRKLYVLDIILSEPFYLFWCPEAIREISVSSSGTTCTCTYKRCSKSLLTPWYGQLLDWQKGHEACAVSGTDVQALYKSISIVITSHAFFWNPCTVCSALNQYQGIWR